MHGILVCALGGLVLIASRAEPSWAQRVVQVGTSVGSATDERGVASSAVTLAPAVTLTPRASTSITLGGSATRFDAKGWSVGGSATMAARADGAAGTAVSLNAGAGVSRSSFGTTFTVADAMPAVEWSSSTLTLFGGAHAAMGRTSVRPAPSATPPVPLPGSTTLVTDTRRLLGPIYGAQWRPLGATGPAAISYREERSTVSGAPATERLAGLSLVFGPVSLGGTAGERTSAAERSQYASGSMSVALSGTVRLEASTGRYPSDRLTGAAAGRYVTGGLAFTFGDNDESRLPVPRGIEPPGPGLTRLSIRATEARVVDLYGDWNSWTPTRARRAANGVWYVDIPLAPGEYRYAFRVNEVEWRVPDGAVAADDGFGGKSAYVTVVRPVAQHGINSREDGR